MVNTLRWAASLRPLDELKLPAPKDMVARPHAAEKTDAKPAARKPAASKRG